MEENFHEKLANLLFPAVTETPDELLARVPRRVLAAGAEVTRYAPSPTGFLHIGGIYSALFSERIAHQTGGVFMLRIEDTDKEREIENGVELLARGLEQFGLHVDEGVRGDLSQRGEYGPYIQSQRLKIYQACAKELVRRGGAYPCFCSSEELALSREQQELQKIKTGYYCAWAKHRDFSYEEVEAALADGKKFALRLRAAGDGTKKIQFTDEVKGALTLTENDQDAVLLKSDGYPTYHWAHAVDDTFMQTTCVIRGDEWLPSAPLHVELFAQMGWPAPRYAHIAPITKIDGSSKRKLSKRKDSEANVAFYLSEGYPVDAVLEYLLNLANSNFEDWRKENPTAPRQDFKIDLSRSNVSGALFDFVKLNDISKQIIARMSVADTAAALQQWAVQFHPEFAARIAENLQYISGILGIEHDNDKRRKDLAKWSDAPTLFAFFFDDVYAAEQFMWSEKISREDVAEILENYHVDFSLSAEAWLQQLRAFAEERGFASDTKTYKASPEKFKGHLGDVAGVLRMALTKRTNTPDLYEMIHVMGEERVHARLAAARASMNG